jgi:hypothetical protein
MFLVEELIGSAPDNASWTDCGDDSRLGFYQDQTADAKIARPMWSIGDMSKIEIFGGINPGCLAAGMPSV